MEVPVEFKAVLLDACPEDLSFRKRPVSDHAEYGAGKEGNIPIFLKGVSFPRSLLITYVRSSDERGGYYYYVVSQLDEYKEIEVDNEEGARTCILDELRRVIFPK